jgi:hypothetical protein
VLRAVQDIGFRRLRIVGRDQFFLHGILNLFHRRNIGAAKAGSDLPGQAVQRFFAYFLIRNADIRPENRVADFAGIKGNDYAVALSDGGNGPLPGFPF